MYLSQTPTHLETNTENKIHSEERLLMGCPMEKTKIQHTLTTETLALASSNRHFAVLPFTLYIKKDQGIQL